jgi:hypothetical protein
MKIDAFPWAAPLEHLRLKPREGAEVPRKCSVGSRPSLPPRARCRFSTVNRHPHNREPA